MMKVITFKIEPDLLEQLDKYAIKNGLNRSEAIRKAITEFLKNNLEEEPVPPMKIEKMRL